MQNSSAIYTPQPHPAPSAQPINDIATTQGQLQGVIARVDPIVEVLSIDKVDKVKVELASISDQLNVWLQNFSQNQSNSISVDAQVLDLLRMLRVHTDIYSQLLDRPELCDTNTCALILGFNRICAGARIRVPDAGQQINFAPDINSDEKAANDAVVNQVRDYAGYLLMALSNEVLAIFHDLILDIAQRLQVDETAKALSDQDKENAHYAAGMAELTAQNFHQAMTSAAQGEPVAQSEETAVQFFEEAFVFAASVKTISA